MSMPERRFLIERREALRHQLAIQRQCIAQKITSDTEVKNRYPRSASMRFLLQFSGFFTDRNFTLGRFFVDNDQSEKPVISPAALLFIIKLVRAGFNWYQNKRRN
jgi:hypothetical protein